MVLTHIETFSAIADTLCNKESSRNRTNGALVNKTKDITSQEVEYLPCLFSLRCPHVNPEREHSLFPLIPQRLGEMEGN